MTSILALETATEACSATLLVKQSDTEITLYRRFQLAPREHTKLILPMLDEVLAEAKLSIKDVDAIAFGRGPGAFTGLRIAAGIAQGLALSVDKPTIPVSSLTAMALAAKQEIVTKESDSDFSVLVAIDARMGEVYWAEYMVQEGVLEIVGEEQLSTPSILFDKAKSNKQSTILVGSGWDEYLDGFKQENLELDFETNITFIPNKFPDAQAISELALAMFEKGDLQSIEDAQPVYLRNNVAKKSTKSI